MKLYAYLLLTFIPVCLFGQQDEPLFGGKDIDVNMIADLGGAIGLSKMSWSDGRNTRIKPFYSFGGELLCTSRYAGLGFRGEVLAGSIENIADINEEIDFVAASVSMVLAIEPIKDLVLTAGPVYSLIIDDEDILQVSNFLLTDKFWGLSFTSDYVIKKWILGIRSHIGLQPLISFGGGPQEVTGKLRSLQLKVGYNLL